jgi:hypothetical protein
VDLHRADEFRIQSARVPYSGKLHPFFIELHLELHQLRIHPRGIVSSQRESEIGRPGTAPSRWAIESNDRELHRLRSRDGGDKLHLVLINGDEFNYCTLVYIYSLGLHKRDDSEYGAFPVEREWLSVGTAGTDQFNRWKERNINMDAGCFRKVF